MHPSTLAVSDLISTSLASLGSSVGVPQLLPFVSFITIQFELLQQFCYFAFLMIYCHLYRSPIRFEVITLCLITSNNFSNCFFSRVMAPVCTLSCAISSSLVSEYISFDRSRQSTFDNVVFLPFLRIEFFAWRERHSLFASSF